MAIGTGSVTHHKTVNKVMAAVTEMIWLEPFSISEKYNTTDNKGLIQEKCFFNVIPFEVTTVYCKQFYASSLSNFI